MNALRDLFAREALAQIPKILTLLDRNSHSPTYGCFDRNYWHYKIIDFPSGMAQEFVWPLALAYETNLSNNSYYQHPKIREWVEAGILYSVRSAHKDGSCDDYFPYERAAGAAAFSLLACVESYIILGLQNEEALVFFEKRADWLANHHETGQLTNHQALIALCLELLSQLLKTSKWKRAKSLRLDRILEWQNEEGWFQEYEGCDPGYHTLTISCLARLYQIKSEPRLKEAITKAVELAAQFIHPDGSYGGEYGSRNTYNFFPHGFELVGTWLPDALRINDAFLQGIAAGLVPCYADDHIVGHHTWNYLLAWRDFVYDRPIQIARPAGRVSLPNAQILIDRRSYFPVISNPVVAEETESDRPSPGDFRTVREDTELYIALNKGGVFKLFRNRKLVASDTQFSLLIRESGIIKNAVGHLIGDYQTKIEADEIIIEGQLGWAKQTKMTPMKLIVLRIVMLIFGRFFPNLIRKTLQKMLITGKTESPFHFTRRFAWKEGRWYITDELQADFWENVEAAGIGCDQTSIYVVMSRTFQAGQLQPWIDLTADVQKLTPDQVLRVERRL